jgi:hypothetical protein
VASNSNNPSWRHHYIPEFYLKRWCANGQLVQFSKPRDNVVKPKRVYPRQTGFVDRSKELSGLPLELAQRLENGFYQPVDTLASSVLDAFEVGRSQFNARERSAWARFIMSLLFRNPDSLQAAKARLAEDMADIDRVSELRYQKKRTSSEPATFRDYVALPASQEALDHAVHKIMADTADSARIGEYIINMQWGSLTLPWSAPALMTSDRPVYILNGLRHPECEILMPIGPKRLFYALNDASLARQLGRMDSYQLVMNINEIVVKRAARFVYAMGDGELDYVQENMSVSQEPTLAERSISVRNERLRRSAKRR